MWNFWRFILKSELRTLWKKVIKWEAEEKKNGTRITAWAALPAVWQTNKQTKQRQQRHCYVLYIWIWRCDTTNSGHIGIREFQDLCQEFGIEEVVRGDIYCYYPFISIDIEQVIGNEELAYMNNNLNTWTEATFRCDSFANIFRLMDFPHLKSFLKHISFWQQSWVISSLALVVTSHVRSKSL